MDAAVGLEQTEPPDHAISNAQQAELRNIDQTLSAQNDMTDGQVR